MQDPKNPAKFCIVERYEQESSQQYHLNNPVRPHLPAPLFLGIPITNCFPLTFTLAFRELTISTGRQVATIVSDPLASNTDQQTFDPYVMPLLAKPMDLTRWEEM